MYIQEIRLLYIMIMLPLLFLSYGCYDLWVNPSPVSVSYRPQKGNLFFSIFGCSGVWQICHCINQFSCLLFQYVNKILMCLFVSCFNVLYCQKRRVYQNQGSPRKGFNDNIQGNGSGAHRLHFIAYFKK